MKEFNDIEDIEQLLKPQCEFHASDNLKDEVVAKAKEIAKAEARPRRISIFAWLAAACVAGFLVFYLMPPEAKVEETPVVAKVERKASVAEKHDKEKSSKGCPKEGNQKEGGRNGCPFRSRAYC